MELSATTDPIDLFQQAANRARAASPTGDISVVLATSDANGQPNARVVLLKGLDSGFVFFTNQLSTKAKEFAKNPKGALCFFWPDQDLQVRARGNIFIVSPEEADAYFATRPRESQIGAHASKQSEPIASRDELLKAFDEVTKLFEHSEVPRPKHWGGYRLIPQAIEFWYRGDHRLHDRFLFETGDRGATWSLTRLSP